MIRYIIRRLIHTIPLLLGITVISFVIISLAPGDYFTRLELNPEISRETLKRMREEFGLDKPIYIQYIKWLWRILHLDFGISFAYHIPVITLIKQRLPNTLLLSLVVLFLLWTISIPIALFSAIHKYKAFDKLVSIFSYISMSLPSFFIAFIFIFIACHTHILPIGGIVSIDHDELSFFGKIKDIVSHLVIPASCIILGGLGWQIRIMRGYVLEVLESPFITGAKARGVSESKVIFKHTLRNAMNPMITIFGFHLSSILSGSALIEIITRWPGMGRLIYDAVLSQDLYLVMGSLVISSILLIIGNLIADILLALCDPRIRH
ncbi:TPA: ABC transporter substrate-binding protein [bacterium]|nr:ABC transporter substrate-binding protein [bacterium]